MQNEVAGAHVKTGYTRSPQSLALLQSSTVSHCGFASWLVNWCCVPTHELSSELSILSTVWGKCLVVTQLFKNFECHTGKVAHPFVLNATTSISFKCLVLVLQGRIVCSKAFSCARHLTLFSNVHTVISLC